MSSDAASIQAREITTTIRRRVIKQCPHRAESDIGDLTIVIDGPAPELHGLAACIDAICLDPITHEAFTAAVAGLFNRPVTVHTEWHTGPWTVEVTA